MNFEWDERKNHANKRKHGIGFEEAQYAFSDVHRVIAVDVKHSDGKETRYFCYGCINELIVTVRFTIRADRIRIFGAGYWREGKNRYEEAKKI